MKRGTIKVRKADGGFIITHDKKEYLRENETTAKELIAILICTYEAPKMSAKIVEEAIKTQE